MELRIADFTYNYSINAMKSITVSNGQVTEVSEVDRETFSDFKEKVNFCCSISIKETLNKGVKIIPAPLGFVENNCLYSLRESSIKGEQFSKWLKKENVPDGTYLYLGERTHNRYGWASGCNFYGFGLIKQN